MIRFDNRVAVVTGAGRGIGRAYALELARRGARVVVNDLGVGMDGSGADTGPAADVVREIRGFGGEAIANGADITDRAQAIALVDAAIGQWGRIDVLINNAGILRDKTFTKKNLDDFEAVVNVHLWGTVNVTHAAWPHMMNNLYGRILLTSSGSGILGNFGQSDYGTAKTAMLGLMNCLAIEGGRKNVHINAIKPAAGTRMAVGVVSDEIFNRLKPELIVPAALYLVSEEAPTGTLIQASGGHFSQVMFAQSKGVNFEGDVSVDDVAARFEEICGDGTLIPVQHQETE